MVINIDMKGTNFTLEGKLIHAENNMCIIELSGSERYFISQYIPLNNNCAYLFNDKYKITINDDLTNCEVIVKCKLIKSKLIPVFIKRR
jgi:hypothetical protein